MRILALGDSYTVGTGVSYHDRWPTLLAARLQADGITVQELSIIAANGWTTDELLVGISRAAVQAPYDLVTLLIGVNNQYRGQSVDVYAMDFSELLDQAVEFTGGLPGKVIVISIPDWGGSPFASGQNPAAISAGIDRFNKVNRTLTKDREIAYVDVTGISRQAAGKPDMFAEDSLHPSRKQYELWVEAIYPAVTRAKK